MDVLYEDAYLTRTLYPLVTPAMRSVHRYSEIMVWLDLLRHSLCKCILQRHFPSLDYPYLEAAKVEAPAM